MLCPIRIEIDIYSNQIEGNGDVAQMVERSLSMREVRGSIPRISNLFLKIVIFFNSVL